MTTNSNVGVRQYGAALLAFGAAISAFYGPAVIAADVTVPHQFTAGTVAQAEQVNENFQALADAINSINQRLSQSACAEPITTDLDYKFVYLGVGVGGGANFVHVENDSSTADVCLKTDGTFVYQGRSTFYTEINGPQPTVSELIEHVEATTGNDPGGELETFTFNYQLNADCSLDLIPLNQGDPELTIQMDRSLSMGVGATPEKAELCEGGNECSPTDEEYRGDSYLADMFILLRKGEGATFCSSL